MLFITYFSSCKKLLGLLHTVAEGREAVGFHQSDCMKPRIRPLDLSHERSKSKGRRSPKCLHGSVFLDKGDKLLKEVWVGQGCKPK